MHKNTDPLDPVKIKGLINIPGIEVEVFDQLASTNDYLRDFRDTQDIRVCLAEMQTRGRGRMQRYWHSPFGQNLYFSMLYPFRQQVSTLAGLSLAVGLAVCCTIEETYTLPAPVLVKWPNDILCEGKKLAGSLIEIMGDSRDGCRAIIGIGINVNMEHDKNDQIDQPWISIRKLNQRVNDRNVLCAALIDQLILYIQRFIKYGLASFLDEWRQRDALVGKTICLKCNGQPISGVACGIDAQGQLVLELLDGTVHAFSSGDSTVV